MKISLNWLNEYVEVKEFFSEPNKLADWLTRAGLEVEEIEDFRARFRHLWVGVISDLQPHPQADRLTVCRVKTGDNQEHQIICGAKNHKAGDKVVAALPGALLPGGLAIKKSKIRGVESAGMLCSEKELGLASESQGILILPADAPVGQEFALYSGLDDIVFELKVTPNRADCLSHFGLAREVACLLDRPFQLPLPSLEEDGPSTRAKVTLKVSASDQCPRYCGRYIEGVEVKESPLWLKKRLESVGLNSINNIVDVTNFVMLELGQPLHAFDFEQIRDGRMEVGLSAKGEDFITLDGTEIKLSGEELMIRDGERPVALAGVVGGLNSGISKKTTSIFVESAYFTPQSVRRTARKFGIETDSAYRFSRGVDPEGTMLAMNRACQLIQQVAGGRLGQQAYDEYPNPVKKVEIELSLEDLEANLGYPADPTLFIRWMERLGCIVQQKSEGGRLVFLVTPPAYRVDLALDVDLIEEYARLNGYEHIPETLPSFDFAPSGHDQAFVLGQRVHELAQAQGFQQAVNYAFVSSRWQEEFLGEPTPLIHAGIELAREPVKIINPLNEDLDVMRISLLPDLMSNLLHGYRYGSVQGRLYEVGSTFYEKDSSYGEWQRLALMAWGFPVSPWGQAEPVPLVYELKEAMEQILLGLYGANWRWQNLAEGEAPQFLHPGQSAYLIFEGKPVGFVGTLHPGLLDQYKIRHQVALGEFDLAKILRGQPKKPRVRSLAKFPAVERDLAFLLPIGVSAGDVAQEIRRTAGEVLKDLAVFDVFVGEALGGDMRSVGYRLKYQDQKGTLEESQILDLQQRVIDSVCRKFSVRVR